ncbi:MAG TPA: hypothetical protein VES93_09340 [Ornithinibacter sp.]|nr:hypothetical protein [Ornithinibacter sp.]
MSRRSPAALLLAVLLALLTPVAARAGTAPGAPTSLKAVATIEGVRLTWQPAAYVAGEPSATGWVVTRTGPGIDRTWTITKAGFPWQLDDDELPAGVVATYAVRATAGGVDGAPSEPVTSAKAADLRPFAPARQALTVTWGHEDDAHQSAALVGDQGDALQATPVAGGVAITRVGYTGLGPSLTVPWPVTDGTYEVGTADGQLDVSATGQLGSCTGATGSVRILHAVPSRLTWWAAVSIDADLTCSDGATVRASGRLSTPETVSAVTGPRATAVGASPGGTATSTHVVRNVGQESVDLTGARLVRTSQADPAGVLSVALGSCAGATLAPGETCSLSLREDRPAADPVWTTYTARVVVTTSEGESTVGTVFGTDRDELAGPQAVLAQGRPGLTSVSWTPGTANSFSTYTVLDENGSTIGSSTSTPVYLKDLAVGAHVFRLRQVLDDGRVYTTAPFRFVVPSEWLYVDSGGKGVRAVGVSADPDVLDGLRIAETDGGLSRMTTVHLASSPTRAEHAAFDRYSGDAWFFTSTQIQRSWYTEQSKAGRYRPDGAVLAVQLSELRDGDVVVKPGGIALRTQATGVVTEIPNSRSWVFADWTPDGTSLLVVPTDGPGLFRMNPTTGATTAVPGAGDAGTARVSRTGRVAVYRYSFGTLYEIPLAGGTQKDLGIYAWGRDYTWDTTGTRLAVGSAAWMATGTGELWDLSGSTGRKIRDLPTSRSVTWVDPVSSAPAPVATVAAWTTAAPTVTVSATDPDDAPGGLRTECRLDTSPTWVPCAGAWKPGTLAAGSHTLTVRATDPANVVGQTNASWKVDATAPTASLTALPAARLTTSIPLTWSGTDTGGSGPSRYDVRYRKASTGSGLGAYTYPSTLQLTTAKATTLKVSAGYQYCLSVRARDVAGNVGAWGTERCTVIAMDDRSLTASKGWSRGTSTSYVYGTWTKATTSKVSLTRSGVSAKRIGIIATTCSTCGSVDVWVGSTYAGRVSLVSSTWRTKQVKWLATFASTRSGTLTLRTTSSRTTIVDGVLVSH